MRTTLMEKFGEVAVAVFLWGFRILVVFVVIVGTILTIQAGKYSGEQWIDFVVIGIARGSIYALIALGYTMVYGVLEFINFAHSEIFAIGAFVGVEILIVTNAAGGVNQLLRGLEFPRIRIHLRQLERPHLHPLQLRRGHQRAPVPV